MTRKKRRQLNITSLLSNPEWAFRGPGQVLLEGTGPLPSLSMSLDFSGRKEIFHTRWELWGSLGVLGRAGVTKELQLRESFEF